MNTKVTLESFLQAQKVSVRKMLQKNFRKYITFGEEINQLLMHQLQGLVLKEQKYQKVSSLLLVQHISSLNISCDIVNNMCRLKVVD